MKVLKKVINVLLIIAVVLTSVFLVGRYGWKLNGFRACQDAGITSVEVYENAVYITGFYPGSFPEGFCGYYSEEQDGKLYVGFHFSAVFGFFENGDFDITIPIKNKINEVIVKTSMSEHSIWNESANSNFQSERDGVYVKLERNDVHYISMSYDVFTSIASSVDNTTFETGKYTFMDNDIMMTSKDKNAPVPFTITVTDAVGTVIASGEFSFDAKVEKMYLTITLDGKIIENTIDE